MKEIKSSKILSSFWLSVVVYLLIFSGITYTENSVTTVSDISFPQSNQIIPPAAYGGRNIITYISRETMFRGYGSSVDDYIVKYEWDFDGDGQYDWESAESGLSYHTYKVPGNYIAFFRVTDSGGNSSIDSIEVQVNQGNGKQESLIKKGREDSLGEQTLITSQPAQAAAGGDSIINKYAVMINGSNESRHWDDVTFMYFTLIDDYQFLPESIYLFNYNGSNPSGSNPENMIDYAAQKNFIDNAFTELGNIMDSDDELFVWITGHGRGYNGPESEHYGYMDGTASVDPDDEEDYLESDFKLRSFYTGGNYKSDHGMDVWKVFYSYYSSGNYKMWRHKYVSHFTGIYFEDTDETKSDGDVFIERLGDYLAGDYNRNGIIETSMGEVYDYDGDGVSPYNPITDSFDEDDWGTLDYYDDDVTGINSQVPGDSYIIFDANLDNRLDIDIDYDINNLEVDGTDLDNKGLFDGIDVNSDGDMNDWVSIDELIQIYGDKLSDDELAVFLNRVNAGIISIVAEPCFSGGFVEDLSSPNRVISTASEEEALSYGNVFIRNFISAFHGASFTGTPVDADYDSNGLISMQEAFNYASLYDYYDEIPQYDDNGDGTSNPYPIPGGGDGNLGANVYLIISDNDGDGYNNGVDCNDNDPAINPGAVEDCTDGIDNDCDNLTDAADPDAINCPFTCIDTDGDGYGNPGDSTCPNGSAIDCDDNNLDIHPGASDANCDDFDDNCSGTPDDEYLTTTTNCGIGACAATGQLECQGGVEVDTCTPGDPQTEICENSIDENCDGQDDICPQGDLVTITKADWNATKQKIDVRATSSENGNAFLTVTYGGNTYPMTYKAKKLRFEFKLQPIQYYPIVEVISSLGGSARSSVTGGDCIDNDIDGYGSGADCLGSDCNDSDAAISPAAAEVCNLIDDNCDGNVDEGFDADSDGFAVCAADCDDTNPAINPDTYWYQDFDGDGYGDPSVTLQQCNQPAGFVSDNTDCDDDDADIFPGGPPVRISGTTPVYYSTLQGAYNTAVDGDIIQSQAALFTENLNINRNISLTLEGGYDCNYTTKIGKTIIKGQLAKTNGTVASKNFHLMK